MLWLFQHISTPSSFVKTGTRSSTQRFQQRAQRALGRVHGAHGDQLASAFRDRGWAMGWWENAGKLLLIYGRRWPKCLSKGWGFMGCDDQNVENWGKKSPLDGQHDDKPS